MTNAWLGVTEKRKGKVKRQATEKKQQEKKHKNKKCERIETDPGTRNRRDKKDQKVTYQQDKTNKV